MLCCQGNRSDVLCWVEETASLGQVGTPYLMTGYLATRNWGQVRTPYLATWQPMNWGQVGTSYLVTCYLATHELGPGGNSLPGYWLPGNPWTGARWEPLTGYLLPGNSWTGARWESLTWLLTTYQPINLGQVGTPYMATRMEVLLDQGLNGSPSTWAR